jgi:hypothetical protein
VSGRLRLASRFAPARARFCAFAASSGSSEAIYFIRGHSWQRAEPSLFLAPQINEFEGVLAIASELKRYVDVVGFEKSYFETANVAVARRVQVGNVHERKADIFVVGAEGSGP